MRRNISFSIEPVFITVLPRYLKCRTCSMYWLSHLRCKGQSVTDILFILSALILSPISRPLSRTASSNFCSLCLQVSMSVISSAKFKSFIWCTTFNYMLLVPVLRSRWSMVKASRKCDKTQPCLTPERTQKYLFLPSVVLTQHSESSY